MLIIILYKETNKY